MSERADTLASFVGLPLALVLALLLVQAAPAALDTLARALDTAPPSPVRPVPLVWAGLYLERCFAGAAGGYVHMLRTARRDARLGTWAQQVVAGALMGNYLPTAIEHIHPVFGHIPDPAVLGMAFGLGYAGFAVLSLFERRATTGDAPPLP